MTFTEQLKQLHACQDAIGWVNGRSLRKCWQVCDRGDWMLWLAGKLDIDRKLYLVPAACDCAELALPYAANDVPSKTLETARAWCRGEATLEEVKMAVNAAAVNAAAYDAAAYAADAADAATHAVYAATHAAYATHARNKTLKHCAKLVRKRIPVEVIEAALEEKK